MRSYLILRLAGPMQAWGQPTFEGTRPTGRFPTRSGLLGLLGACLGIQRDDTSSLQALSESVQFAVRCDELILDDRRVSVTGLRDYHTVLGAREDYRGLKSHETIQTWREYLCDASFTVALWLTPQATMVMSELEKAVLKPRYTRIYSEESVDGHHLKFTVRDEPMITLPRQFASREWYVIKGGMDVSQ
ncbi:type I-E CRISPR-associated protein Cas5/CasD [Escherichia coli]|uniref:type I-E CRISPR-associated protein Cas5/CasD n=1 Tax=Escherichia coli TaxID=562 RepID=UPI000BB90964|nr:type I-E CRISPR-associated protein Cas5/CasD [Escherichia coli]